LIKKELIKLDEILQAWTKKKGAKAKTAAEEQQVVVREETALTLTLTLTLTIIGSSERRLLHA